jgi:hypothetical protein
MRVPRKGRKSKAKAATSAKTARQRASELPPASMNVETQAGPLGVAPFGSAPWGSVGVGAASRSMVTGRATLSLLPANWSAERDEVLTLLDAAEPLLRPLVPLVEQAKRQGTPRKRRTPRRGIGDNNPPQAIDALSLDVTQVTVGIDAIEVLRSEIRSPAPRWKVVRICGWVIAGLASMVGLPFLHEFGKETGKLSADAAFSRLQPILMEIADKIGHWLHTLGMPF